MTLKGSIDLLVLLDLIETKRITNDCLLIMKIILLTSRDSATFDEIKERSKFTHNKTYRILQHLMYHDIVYRRKRKSKKSGRPRYVYHLTEFGKTIMYNLNSM